MININENLVYLKYFEFGENYFYYKMSFVKLRQGSVKNWQEMAMKRPLKTPERS